VIVFPSTSDGVVLTRIKAACANNGIEMIALSIPPEGRMSDGVYFNKTGYRMWMAEILSCITRMI
jgi:hypothetical protein